MSFSTGFTSTGDDSVNAERAAEVGIEMEINLDGQSVTSTVWMSSQSKSPVISERFPWSRRRRFTLTY